MPAEDGQAVERISPARLYRRLRNDEHGRVFSAALALFGCMIWVAVTGSTRRKIPIESEKAEAARRRAADIDDWSEVG